MTHSIQQRTILSLIISQAVNSVRREGLDEQKRGRKESRKKAREKRKEGRNVERKKKEEPGQAGRTEEDSPL